MKQGDIEKRIAETKEWLESNKDEPTEEMASFFTQRVDGYDEHMRFVGEGYARMAELLPKDAGKVLDIGCGTGLELAPIFGIMPTLHVVGIDLAQAMLDRLRGKFEGRNVELICGDYFKTPFGTGYDAAITFESLHHFTPDEKLVLYKRIANSIKKDGIYIEGDFYAINEYESSLYFAERARRMMAYGKAADAADHASSYIHVDTPLTTDKTMILLEQAGFSDVSVEYLSEGGYVGIIRAYKRDD